MFFKVFQYAIPVPDELDELNQFLATNRVAAVTHEIVSQPSGATLVVVAQCIGNRSKVLANKGMGTLKTPASSSRIDYKEVLSETDFKIYSQLRELRKQLAEREGVPVYAIFSNAQLAEMVTGKTLTETKLAQIDGVGKGRIEKYGSEFLPILSDEFAERELNL